MLSVKIKIGGHDTTMFRCPECDTIDVVYNLHPKKCYKCGSLQTFDIEKLKRLRPERIRYYRTANHKGLSRSQECYMFG